jgi:hypothetical protein
MGKPKIFEFDKSLKIVLGGFGILITLFIVLTPAINRWAYRSLRASLDCHQRLVILNSAIVEYTAKHDGRLPQADRWCDEIEPYILPQKDIGTPFLCPLDPAKDEHISSYAMNERVSGCVLAQLPKDTVILFETKSGWNRSGGPEDLSFENHHFWENPVSCGILFANGEGWCMDKKTTASLRWEP